MMMIDIRELLDEKLCVPAESEQRFMTEKLLEIISFATAIKANHPPQTVPKCRIESCGGWLSTDFIRNELIYWCCEVCYDEGLISGWQGLLWDMTAEPDKLVYN